MKFTTREYASVMILGSTGRLGSALTGVYGPEVHTPDREQVSAWMTMRDSKLRHAFDHLPRPLLLHIACGIVSPQASANDVYSINTELPYRLASLLEDTRIITFGTVMERIMRPEAMNRYLHSKFKLGQRLIDLRARGVDSLHLQIHTLYGGPPPNANMFAGQMLAAIKEGRRFEMTNGYQLREYHHVTDEVKAIKYLCNHEPSGVRLISHNRPVTLRKIATSIFDAFQKPELLSLGARTDECEAFFQPIDNDRHLPNTLSFREPINGLVTWFKELI